MEASSQDGSEPSGSLRMDGVRPASVPGVDVDGMGVDVGNEVSDEV